MCVCVCVCVFALIVLIGCILSPPSLLVLQLLVYTIIRRISSWIKEMQLHRWISLSLSRKVIANSMLKESNCWICQIFIALTMILVKPEAWDLFCSFRDTAKDLINRQSHIWCISGVISVKVQIYRVLTRSVLCHVTFMLQVLIFFAKVVFSN